MGRRYLGGSEAGTPSKDVESPEVSGVRALLMTEGELPDSEFVPDRGAFLRSNFLLSVLVLASLPFFLVAAIATHLWHKFTPVYQEVSLEFGGPDILGMHSNIVDLKFPLIFRNPNPYPIQIHERQGTILLANSARELGQFRVPSSLVPKQSFSSVSVESRFTVDSLQRFTVLPELPEAEKQESEGLANIFQTLSQFVGSNEVEFWFVAEELDAEAKINLLTRELNIAIMLGRACSAKFKNDAKKDAKPENMFCSQNREQLAKGIAQSVSLLPGLTAKYETLKNQTVQAMMVVGYFFGGLFLFFASLTYEGLRLQVYHGNHSDEARRACIVPVPLVACGEEQEVGCQVRVESDTESDEDLHRMDGPMGPESAEKGWECDDGNEPQNLSGRLHAHKFVKNLSGRLVHGGA